MNILLLGSGGKEHAIAWKLSQSSLLHKLYIAPGNAGTASTGINVSINPLDFESIKQFVLNKYINMVIVGPEDPLVKGIHDYFLEDERLKNIPLIGPQREAAKIEGSKDFAKTFMQRHNIPTAAYRTFTSVDIEEGFKFIDTLKPPYVLKADGLAAGKGVVICQTREEARTELSDMLEHSKFGIAGKKVVIEEYLEGIELSVIIITDGKSFKILPVAKDYKKAGEGDSGLNTGGMGCISHVPFADKPFLRKVVRYIIKPTIQGFKNDGIVYKGFLYFGLMNVKGDPYVIEYNARLGDPEAEAVIPRVKTDLLELFNCVAQNKLSEKFVEIDKRYTACVMLVSKGYPGSYEKGKTISGLNMVNDSLIFHSGTISDSAENVIKTNGGRVIAITSYGNTISEALEICYRNAEIIDFEGKYYRKDIGKDLSNEE